MIFFIPFHQIWWFATDVQIPVLWLHLLGFLRFGIGILISGLVITLPVSVKGKINHEWRNSKLSKQRIKPINCLSKQQCLKGIQVTLARQSLGPDPKQGNQPLLMDSRGTQLWSHFMSCKHCYGKKLAKSLDVNVTGRFSFHHIHHHILRSWVLGSNA